MPDAPSLEQLRAASDYLSVRKQVGSGGIGNIIFGALAILLGLAMFNIVNLILVCIGVLLLVVGIWMVSTRSVAGFIVGGICLIIVGVWNIIITVLVIAAGATPRPFWIILGFLQIAWAVQSFKQYSRYAPVSYIRPPRELLDWIDQTAKLIQSRKAKDAPEIIEFQSKSFMGAALWKVSLWPEMAVVLRGRGAAREVSFERKDDIAIAGPPPDRRRGRNAKAELIVRGNRTRILIQNVWLDRFEGWKGVSAKSLVPPPPPPMPNPAGG